MTRSAAAALLTRLAEKGVDTVFTNAGTDTASIIEALAAGGSRYPRFVIVPHENLAMAMANGYYRISGKPAGVLVHVSVGTANTVCQLMNMRRDHVPVILMAGRTPSTEHGHPASRDTMIHWGQEAYDQAAMVREFTKWEYEFRAGQPIAALVDRACDIAMTEPRGPVYLMLPREPLHDPVVPARVQLLRDPPAAAAPPPAAIAEIAKSLRSARFPLIVTSSIGRTALGFETLAALCDDHAIPVFQAFATDASLPTDHPMNLGAGFDLQTYLDRADFVLVVGCLTPWHPGFAAPKPDATIVHIDVDPLVSQFPFRESDAGELVAGDPVAALAMLRDALGRNREPAETRRAEVAALQSNQAERRRAMLAEVCDQRPIHPAWLAHCVDQAKAGDAIIVNEIGVNLDRITTTQPLGYIGMSHAGGLGAGLGSGLGAKLAAPDREVIVTVGDGSYMFGNPLPYHFVQRTENLPTLTIVANNHGWLAVKQSTLAVHPGGHAARANVMPLQSLDPSPAFEKVAESCGGVGISVEAPEELPGTLAKALALVRAGTPVLLNVHIQPIR